VLSDVAGASHPIPAARRVSKARVSDNDSAAWISFRLIASADQ
jgi:hypothetical protein